MFVAVADTHVAIWYLYDDKRLTRKLGAFEFLDESDDNNLTWDEIRASVERHRWTPPPGAKSSLQLLREDRDN